MKKILNDTLQNFIQNGLPHSLLLIGEKGCGKHFYINELNKNFYISFTDYTSSFSASLLDNFLLSGDYIFALFDLDKLTEANQNTLLKFIEEPPQHCYLILLSCNESLVLNTLKGRCFVVNFPQYTDEELLEFTDDKNILSLARTPGQIKELINIDVDKLISLCSNIFLKIDSANIVNILSIADKIAFKDEEQKYTVEIFFRALLSCCRKLYIENKIPTEAYKITNDLLNIYNKYKTVDKRRLFENYLLDLKFLMKSWLQKN